jgi:L-lactate dehydrogenase complex protein LldG
MSAARDEILARIRAVPRIAAEPVVRSYRRTAATSPAERVALFVERVSDYRAEVCRVRGDDVAATVRSVCERHGARRLAIPGGLPAGWRPGQLDLFDEASLDAHRLDRIDGVITGCTLAIAETGTIVLAAGATEGRRASTLVPDLQICIVQENQIVELVTEAIERLHDIAAHERRPITFVSGPSATSDIELSRVEGVHGPRRLVVLVAEGPE